MVGDIGVLPDFNGNRSPLADANSRGVITGLTLDASFDSLARLYYAAAIGIALGTRHILDALNARGYAIDTLHLAGGHAANPVLVRLYADATECQLVVPEGDGILAGTACVAATAAGLYPSLMASAEAMATTGTQFLPDPAHRVFFRTAYERFLRLHAAFRPAAPPVVL
jgi:ribulose kinase